MYRLFVPTMGPTVFGIKSLFLNYIFSDACIALLDYLNTLKWNNILGYFCQV